jgi:hypothetical protein
MENRIIGLIAQDRIEIPLSSLYQRLKREKKANATSLSETLRESRVDGERAYAFFAREDKNRARGMKEAIADFSQQFPKYGAILNGMVAEKRVRSEDHVYFGMNAGCRLTADDYIEVMTSVGLSEGSARSLYPDLMELSRKLAKARDEERSVIVGRYAED